VHAAGVPGQGTWQTTLQGRDLDGNASTFEAYDDTALNITWLADANHAKTSGYDADGRMTWDEAKTWVDKLVVGAYSDWRLPTMVDTGISGCSLSTPVGTDCGFNVQTKDAITGTVYSEMAHLYYVTLGNKAYCSPGEAWCSSAQPGWGLSNTGPFSNVRSGGHWFGVEYAPVSNGAWLFDAGLGHQGYNSQNARFLALAGSAVAGLVARKWRQA
jgi:hypothetical protein